MRVRNHTPARLYFWKPLEGGYVGATKPITVEKENNGMFPLTLIYNYPATNKEQTSVFNPDISEEDNAFSIERKVFLRSGRNAKGEICYMESKK